MSIFIEMSQVYSIVFKDGSRKLINLRTVSYIDLNYNVLDIKYNLSNVGGIFMFSFGSIYSNTINTRIEYDTPRAAANEYDNIMKG